MKCRVIQSNNQDVFLNLAIEHALVQNSAELTKDPIIRIWKNNKSVIVGRGQYVKKEVNQEFCIKHEIDVARRISGGGTVYHDLGNINLSFFLSPPLKKLMNVSDLPSISQMITTIIYQSLKGVGYQDLEINNGSNILYKNKKISGSAGYLYKGWNLHHATLMVGVDLDLLEGSILAREQDPSDSRQSRYFETTNLPNFDVPKWIKSLFAVLFDNFRIEIYNDTLNQNEELLAERLLKDLYLRESWIVKSKRKG